MITFKRTIQAMSFVLFVVLLWLAAFPLTTAVPVDAYLWMDPLIFVGAGLSIFTKKIQRTCLYFLGLNTQNPTAGIQICPVPLRNSVSNLA